MNDHSRYTEIHAIIPHPEHHDMHLVDGDGNYPYELHRTGEGTYELTLIKLGRRLGFSALSVDRLMATDDQKVIYRSKPPQGELAYDSNHSWQTTGQL